jgi:hypothetical protein
MILSLICAMKLSTSSLYARRWHVECFLRTSLKDKRSIAQLTADSPLVRSGMTSSGSPPLPAARIPVTYARAILMLFAIYGLRSGEVRKYALRTWIGRPTRGHIDP